MRLNLNLGEQHSCVTRDDSTMTLCTLRDATVLSHSCCADFGRPLTKEVVLHSHDGPGVTNSENTTAVKHYTSHSGMPPFRYPLKIPDMRVSSE